jgi:surface-anchored protein
MFLCASGMAADFTVLTREHTDFRILYTPGETNLLSLAARDEDRRVNHAPSEVILVAGETSRFTLPAGTPFGDAGAPFWILPQSQNANLLYLGVSAEGLPPGIFDGPLAIALTRFEGPGYFMAWQATGPGQFNIRLNTRDGLSAADAFTPILGSHEHFNWGFSSTGVFCATFQVTGRRAGESTNITSAESTFAFHVLPLPPPTNFLTWQKHFWPPGFDSAIAGADANPDADPFDNWREYAFGLAPTNANPLEAAPKFEFVDVGQERFGALGFTRYLPALDLNYTIEAAAVLPGVWEPLIEVFDLAPDAGGLTESVTIRDRQRVEAVGLRFLRLRITAR